MFSENSTPTDEFSCESVYDKYSNQAETSHEQLHCKRESKERACDSLVMCIVTTLNQGLRNGGGIGDILRAPSSVVCLNNLLLFID